MKNFNKLSLKNSAVIFSLAIALFSCGKAPEHVKHIPKDANVVVVVDVKSMAVKSLDFKNFFNLDFLTRKKSEKNDSLSEKIKNSGIDLLNTAYIFGQIEADNKGYAATVLSLSDATKFEAFVKSLDNSVTVNSLGELKTASLQSNQEILIGWNDKTAIFLGMQADQDKLKEKLTALFNTKEEESLADQNKNFQSLLKQSGDVTLWLNMENMGKFASMASPMAANLNLKETYLQAIMNFEKGEAVVDTKYFTNKEMGDKFSGMVRDNVSDDVTNTLPGKSVIALLGVALDLNKLYDYLEKENLLADFNQNIKQTTGMEGKELFQVFSGDMAASINGMKSLLEPEFAICLGVNDKEKATKLLSSFAEKGMLEKKDNYYSSAGYFIAAKDNKLILGPESMRQQLIDGNGEKLKPELKDLLSSNASVLYFSISDIPDAMLSMLGEKAKNNIKKSPLQAITITGSSLKDNVSTGKMVISFKNKEENSLVTLAKISEDFAEEAAIEPEPSLEFVSPDMPEGSMEEELIDDNEGTDESIE